MLNKRGILLTLLLCLTLIMIIPFTAAETVEDNQTVLTDNTRDILTENNDYYFNSSADDGGNGSFENPYNHLSVDMIKANSTLHFADGEYNLNGRVSVDNLNIIGQSSENTIINYYGLAFIVNNKITLNNLKLNEASIISYGDVDAVNTVFANGEGATFTSGKSYGGAISVMYNPYAKATITNCTFENNHAQYGGAIFMDVGSLEVYNSSFINNYACSYGGAVSCEYCTNVIISKSKFIKNHCIDDAGGAIYVFASCNFNADYLTINASQATYGGAITTLDTKTVLNHIEAYDNAAVYDGGAIYHMYGDFTLTDSNLTNNTARNGGALFLDSSTLNVTDSSFINNTAKLKADAIYSVFSTFTNDLSVNTFENNDVYLTDELNLEIGSRDYTLFKITEDIEITDIPSNYRLDDYDYVTSIKDQKSGGNCWAFTALAVLESCIKKITGIEYDFSEENMKNLMERYSDYGWLHDTNGGGFNSMAWAYLTSWLGPVNDAYDLYDDKSVLSSVFNSLMHVQNILFLSRSTYTDNDAIKTAILKYGAVGTDMYYDDEFLRDNNAYYYSGNNLTNHAVTLVGWNDGYSKDNFNGAVEGDGAWIVKNSWGPDWGDNGYFYVSYYDTKFARIGLSDTAYTFILNDTYKFDRNYQYDIAGPSNYLSNNGSSYLYKNIFNATGNGLLKAVSTYFYNLTNWTVSVKVNDELKSFKKGVSEAGYWTIILDDEVYIKKGDIFEVLFNITTEGIAKVPISSKSNVNHIINISNVSYVSGSNGRNWENIIIKGWVACIKAFAITDDLKTTTYLEVISDGYNPVNIKVRVVDENGKPVSGMVKFNLNGVDLTVNLTDGRASFEYNFEKGINYISATFEKEGYVTSTNATSIEIQKKITELNLNVKRNLNNLAINITAADVINETLIIFINNQNHTANLINGHYSEDLIGLDNGQYDFNVCLTSHVWEAENVTESIVINIKNTQIVAEDLTANDESADSFKITLLDEDGNPLSNKTVVFELMGNSSVKTDDNGAASIPVKLINGIYSVFIRFMGDNDYWPSENQKEITVKTNVEANIFVETSLYDADIEITFSKPINETITVYIDDADDTVNVYNGSVVKDAHGLANGLHNIIVELHNDKYNFTRTIANFTINVIKTQILAQDLTTIESSNENYNVMLKDENNNPLAGKQLKFILNNHTIYAFTDSDGCAGIPINLNGGVYPVTISYSNSSDNYDDFKVTKTISVKTIVTGEIKVEKTLNSAELTAVFSHPINMTLNALINNESKQINVKNGMATLKLAGLENGHYNVNITFPDNDKYDFKEVSSSFDIKAYHTKIIANPLTVYYHDGTFSIKILDENNNPIKNSEVYISLNNLNSTLTTNNDGVAAIEALIQYGLDVGRYDVVLKYPGDEVYFPSQNETTITVLSSIILPQSKYTLNSQYTVILYDNNGLVKQNTAKITLNGVTQIFSTDSNGQVKLNINLHTGSYSVVVENLQTGEVKTQAIQVEKRLSENANIVMYYGAGKSYTVRAHDDHGQSVGAGVTVTFNVAGKNYNVLTNNQGYASFKITLKAGSYQITSTYKGFKVSNKITVKTTLITKNKSFKKGKNIKYAAKLLNKNGKILKNKKITFKIKGKTYMAKTNKKGMATIKIKNLKRGKYTVTIKYGKLTNKNKITIKK